jgi:hypothetical protein
MWLFSACVFMNRCLLYIGTCHFIALLANLQKGIKSPINNYALKGSKANFYCTVLHDHVSASFQGKVITFDILLFIPVILYKNYANLLWFCICFEKGELTVHNLASPSKPNLAPPKGLFK